MGLAQPTKETDFPGWWVWKNLTVIVVDSLGAKHERTADWMAVIPATFRVLPTQRKQRRNHNILGLVASSKYPYKSIAYSFHLRISPLKSASVHECVLLVFGLLGTSPDENSALLEVSPSMDATSQAAQK
jgi:hypothetical protein